MGFGPLHIWTNNSQGSGPLPISGVTTPLNRVILMIAIPYIRCYDASKYIEYVFYLKTERLIIHY